IPSIRTFVQLGRMPLIETCPALPLESNEGALLGVGETPGSRTAVLNRSRLSMGSSVRLVTGRSSLTVEVVLSIVERSALTVTCCFRSPTANDRFIKISEADVSEI